MGPDHGRRVTGIAVHGWCGRNNQLLSAGHIGQHFTTVVNHAAAYAQDAVAGWIKGQHQASNGTLIRFRGILRKAEKSPVDSGFFQVFSDGFPGRRFRSGIADDEWAADPQLFKSCRKLTNSPWFDSKEFYTCSVAPAAGAGMALRINQFR